MTAAQGVADAGHFQALAPYIAHFLLDHFGAGMEDLLHHQPDRQVAAVVDPQAGDGRVQVSHLTGGAQHRAVDHFDQPRRQRGVTTDDLAQVADADFRVFRGLANV